MEPPTDTDLAAPLQDLSKPEEGPVKDNATQKSEVCSDSWFLGLSQFGPLKYVFKLLQAMAAALSLSDEVERDISCPSSPAGRRCVNGTKRLGRLLCFLFSIIPHWLQCLLGYPVPKDIGECDAPEEVRKSPLKPLGKGSKRKQDDVDLEDQHSWIEVLEKDLPEEDEEDEEDGTYEPSKSESDSEEQRSKNDTESDLEFEEKNGVVLLKESQYSEDMELGTSETFVQEQNSSGEALEGKADDDQDGSQPGEALEGKADDDQDGSQPGEALEGKADDDQDGSQPGEALEGKADDDQDGSQPGEALEGKADDDQDGSQPGEALEGKADDDQDGSQPGEALEGKADDDQDGSQPGEALEGKADDDQDGSQPGEALEGKADDDQDGSQPGEALEGKADDDQDGSQPGEALEGKADDDQDCSLTCYFSH
uniref:Uncharacterized protein DDB_G0290685-like isoform X3 n=1 Tax=Geotrypetes seraphini TaxID=260995 RepID=A0A6P8S3R7_GEOSA|nr:uncharacterized protein DDB_G0290685-like isoform X3 [Geotrypetes seraphini]